MSAPKPTYVARVEARADCPDWLYALAEQADRTSQAEIAKRIGYSTSVVSQTLAGSYRGDMRSLADAVRGALMGATVMCPVMGEIAKDHCLEEQRIAKAATSGLRMQLARACKSCPHSRSRADK